MKESAPTIAGPLEYSFSSRRLSAVELASLPPLTPSTSSWAAIAPSVPQPWSLPTLRGLLLNHLKTRSQPAHAADPASEQDLPARHHARETLALLHQYLTALASSPFGHLYSKALTGSPVASPLRAEAFWELHTESCSACSARGSWQQARLTNDTNPCFIADVLAIIWHGWLPVFDSVPAPFDLPNSPSLNRAPSSARLEHTKSLEFGAIADRPSDFISPLIAVIRPHEVDEQVARLRSHGVPVTPAVAANVDALNALISPLLLTIPYLAVIKTRLCIDLSRVVNSHLRPWSFRYHSVQDALALLYPHAFLAKVDLTRMFHQLPLHPAIQQFFAYRFLGRIWTCLTAPFGGTSTPAFANLLAGITAMIIFSRGVPSVFVTDDSLYTGRTLEDCRHALHVAISTMERLGWLLNRTKIEGPAQLLVFLGILINSVSQTLGIATSRLSTLLDRLDLLLVASPPTVRDVLSMAGRLQWVAAVFPRGRPFMAALYVCARGHPDSPCPLSPQARADLLWWRGHLLHLRSQASADRDQAAWTRFNFNPLPRPIRIFSDASGDMSLGFGLILDPTLVRGRWVSPQHKSSAYLEYIPILHLLRHHHLQLSNRIVICHTDNAANALAITRGSTLAPTCITIFREIYTLACDHNIILLGDWCPREFLGLLDGFSKHQK